MTRPDDSLLEQHQLVTVRYHADLLLKNASAQYRFPTPVNDIMAAARLTVIDDADMHEGMLRQFLRKASAGFTATLKSALSKVLGLFEANDRLVLIDKDVPLPRVPFIMLHEAGHGSLPHQSKMYALIHDCDKTLHPDITDLFEREANVFASEVLFQGEIFAQEAHQFDFGIKVPMNLSKKYGASNYSTFRRYVTTNPSACCVVVLDPVVCGLDGTFEVEPRRTTVSTSFHATFDSEVIFRTIGNKHVLGPVVPIGRRMSRPTQISISDRNGQEHECIAEAFDTKHQIFILIRDMGPRTATGIVMPSTWKPSILNS
jgi:Zn-dependent peptidase ImmA (M78 family)